MFYYQFNVGAYRTDTSHLSILEHGVYRQLIDTYYVTESPLSCDINQIARLHRIRSEDELAALRVVLDEFFYKTDDGYRHSGCDKVMKKVYSKSEKARLAAEKKWELERLRKCERIENVCERNANASKNHANAHKNDANAMLPVTCNPIPVTHNTIPNTINHPPTGVVRWSALTCELPDGINVEAWRRWAHARSSRKKPISELAAKAQWKVLLEHAKEIQNSMIESSIANDYQGIFPPKSGNTKQSINDKISDQSRFIPLDADGRF